MTKQMKIKIAGIVAVCAVVAVALAAGVAYASGMINQSNQKNDDRAVVQQSSTDTSSSSSNASSPSASSSSAASSSSSSDAATEAGIQADATNNDQTQANQTAEQPIEQLVEQPQEEVTVVTQETIVPAQPEYREPEPVQTSTVSVSVYIDSSRAAGHGYPSSMGSANVELDKGSSVYDALLATGVAVGGSSSYVSSIGGLSEFACGQGSGWLYLVNGVSPGYGCGSYILNDGDSVTWVYTLDLGNDI